MILLLWLGRLLDSTSVACRRAADVVYRPYFSHENRKAKRESERRAIEELIANARPNRVGSPLYRDR